MIKSISSEEYHAHEALGSSTIKLARRSLAKFKAKIEGRIPDTKSRAMEIGTVAHSCILEKDMNQFVVGPPVKDKRAKAWKDFVKAHEDKTVLSVPEFEVLKGMYDAFFKHPVAGKIIDKGEPEVSIFNNIQGLELKARLDYLVESDKGLTIVDYKTSKDASADSFSKDVYKLGYDVSAGHYILVTEAELKKEVVNYFWVVQEKEAPFEIAVYRADPSLIARSKKMVWGLYENIKKAKDADVWPGLSSEIMNLDIPSWAVAKESN